MTTSSRTAVMLCDSCRSAPEGPSSMAQRLPWNPDRATEKRSPEPSIGGLGKKPRGSPGSLHSPTLQSAFASDMARRTIQCSGGRQTSNQAQRPPDTNGPAPSDALAHETVGSDSVENCR